MDAINLETPVFFSAESTGRKEFSQTRSANPPKWALWSGWILHGLVTLFLIFDVGVKLLEMPVAVEATVKLGFPADTVFGIGVVGLVLLILYLIPRTAIAGAILWTGYLGGAVAANVRMANPLFSNTLFPIYFAVLLWGGLWLRDRRVSALFAPKH